MAIEELKKRESLVRFARCWINIDNQLPNGTLWRMMSLFMMHAGLSMTKHAPYPVIDLMRSFNSDTYANRTSQVEKLVYLAGVFRRSARQSINTITELRRSINICINLLPQRKTQIHADNAILIALPHLLLHGFFQLKNLFHGLVAAPRKLTDTVMS